MRLHIDRLLLPALAVLPLAACGDGSHVDLVGTLEWDRVAVLAEQSEPVVAIKVKEGERVKAGQALLRLDPRRTEAELHAAEADVQRLTAQRQELRHGPRAETIDAARAEVARAESNAKHARRERDRVAKLRKSGARSQAQLDNAANALRVAEADADAAHARLAELLHGTRPEKLAQAEAALAKARAEVKRLTLTRERLDVRAPRAGRVDALPFRLGDQPPAGATLVSLLAGPAPYCRVYVPERRRASVQPGDHYRVRVDGVDRSFEAVLRSVRSEPAFTPYYALSGEDATRLSYRAELVIEDDAAGQLPAGLPCHAEPADRGR